MKENQLELLQFCVSEGIIDMSDMQEKYNIMMERRFIEENHHYKIWKGTNENWYTYVFDQTKNNNRRLIKKKTEKELLTYLKDLYSGNKPDSKPRDKRMLFCQLVEKWIEYKKIHTNSTGYIKRILSDYHKYYEPNKEFINKRVIDFNSFYLDLWAHTLIKEKNLTQRQFSNLAVIIRQSMDYAVMLNIIHENPMKNVKINTKLYRKQKKKESNTQVYSIHEQQQLSEQLVLRYNKKRGDTTPLLVLLCFETGLRVGELCSLKISDIDKEMHKVHVQRQAIRLYKEVDSLRYSVDGWGIGEYTKTDDGDRKVYLTKYAKKIIEEVIKCNNIYLKKYDDFLFVKDDKKIINPADVDYVIECCCNKAGIPVKRIHKIRKTYISTLIDSGLNINEIRQQVGHADERTTYANYCYNRLEDSETEMIIENALKSNQSNQKISI